MNVSSSSGSSSAAADTATAGRLAFASGSATFVRIRSEPFVAIAARRAVDRGRLGDDLRGQLEHDVGPEHVGLGIQGASEATNR